MKNPFKIEVGENPDMRAWEIVLQIGDFKSKGDAEEAAKTLAEFVSGDGGWHERVQ